ncbi:carboxypeptidase-like regulatory domain-containing protein [Hyalangium rubrum]|uniref:Carboxypeptidase-like regulatory domain-containing protein n=1 Tax=Hyalangium rubrum TaxID=3103134 RepID=A0ABU5GW45_9BACT|nr:carboxypeptidase-like regulatory domain-containing protein [Hyalangium sp. s54d21]MDY7225311.1 carboxypeptidase-like regulatory domain-containing protein [Hyalangium sp. s54d21]
MFRLRILAVILGLGFLPACDNRPVVDNGGDLCEEELVTLRVEVLTADGARVKGATVTAIHLETNQSITGVTNEEGISRAVNESLGAGTVRLHATAGAKVSPPLEVEWQCDGCHCSPIPGAVTLQLNP